MRFAATLTFQGLGLGWIGVYVAKPKTVVAQDPCNMCALLEVSKQCVAVVLWLSDLMLGRCSAAYRTSMIFHP
jgi:hypothetical protein